MDGRYAEIYERVKPYLDTRHNEIHTQVAYGFARRLLALHPQADEGVVLPAVILHDAGWKMVPEEQQLKAFGPNMEDRDTRRRHEVEGARIAREILAAVGYDADRCQEILDIIDGHDSRETALSLNDQLVKDSDKLWRFTQIGIETDHRRFAIELRAYLPWLGQQIDGWLFTPEARQMAREAFAAAEAALLG